MYISEVRIDGFTSYLTDTSVADFHPGVNVVVGRNGAGKSNFFAAIRFVLSDLTERSTTDLIYNGRGRRAVSCRVEIVLADTGSRFASIGGETVAIGREVVSGSDRYLVNGKHVTKSQVRALLDSAGLSYGGNAYFIVPQGDVTRLASATDESRLEALLTASGAQTFEDRKLATLVTLDKSNERLTECKTLLNSMARHLENVGQDAENLREHLELRKQLRGVEYVLLSVEKFRTGLVIAAENEKFDEQRERLDQALAVFKQCDKELDLGKTELSNAEASLAEAEAELQMAEKESDTRRHEAKSASNLAANAKNSSGFFGGDESLTLNMTLRRSQLDSDVMDLEDSNENASSDVAVDEEATMAALHSNLESLQTRLTDETKKLSAMSARLRALQLKEGRGSQLSSAEREKSRRDAVKRTTELVIALKESLQQETSRETELKEYAEKASGEVAEAEARVDELAEELADATSEQQFARQELSEAESSRAMALLSHRKAEIARERLEKATDQQTKQLLSTNRSSVVRGIRGIRGLAQELNLTPSQYYGTIADLIEVQPTVSHAVDRIAGSQMFYHVVDNADTARRLVEAIENPPWGKYGSATFVPLADVIVDSSTKFAEVDGTTPLSSMVHVQDARFDKLVQLLFGKYVLCQDLKTAMKYSREHLLPAVTVEGDLCDPRGAISGGSGSDQRSSSSNSSSRQELIRELGKIQDSILRQLEEAKLQRAQADAAAQRVTQCVDKLNKAKVRLMRASVAKQDASMPVIDMREQLTTLRRQIDDSRVNIEKLEAQLSAAEEEQRVAASETSFAGALSESERSEIDELSSSIGQLKTSCDELGRKYYELTTIHQDWTRRHELERNAKLRREANEMAADDSELSAAAAEAEEKFSAAQAETVRKRRAVDGAQQDVSQAQEQVRSLEDAVSSADQNCKNISRKVENHSVKLKALSVLRQDLDKKLQGLGSIPESALEQARPFKDATTHASESADTVMSDSEGTSELPDERELKTIVKDLNVKQKELNEALSEQGEVNQRAINDYETYAAELESLQAQYDKILSERTTIEHTVQVLDSQKREKLDAMLSKVVSKFGSVFKMLSGGERGTLVLNRNDETGELVSVGLDVSFGESAAQMSGGQKSLCALALIFAVQACDPAAFYVFDEIDANLDEAARKRVAATVKAISESSKVQFICTTFREELVKAGNAWFGVTYEGRESSIKAISKDLALEFITVDVPNE